VRFSQVNSSRRKYKKILSNCDRNAAAIDCVMRQKDPKKQLRWWAAGWRRDADPLAIWLRSFPSLIISPLRSQLLPNNSTLASSPARGSSALHFHFSLACTGTLICPNSCGHHGNQSRASGPTKSDLHRADKHWRHHDCLDCLHDAESALEYVCAAW